jgi:predicted O-methyltransferase YrrM
MVKTFLHYLKFLLGIDKPETQTSLEEQNLIKKYASQAVNAVEIGMYEGYNSKIIASAVKGTLYGIDPFFADGFFKTSYQEKITKKYLAENANVVFIKKLSWDAADEIPEGVDFIFIDGDHSYEGIKKDWELFSAKICKGGIIALHDTTAPAFQLWKANMGSVLFFNEHIIHDKRFIVKETVDSLNILQKI